VARQVTDGPGYDHQPDWSPDGRFIAYACYRDDAVELWLLEAATGWLRGRGCRRAVGPMNGGVHRLNRLLTRGFEAEPLLLEPRNPPSHPLHFAAAGFAPALRWFTSELDRTAAGRLAVRMRRLASRQPGLRVELPDPRRPDLVLPRLHALLDRCWAGFPGWAPFGLAEFVQLFGGLLAVLPPGHLAVAVDAAGHDVGLGYMVPDWIEEVRALRGDAAGWGRWMGGPLPPRVLCHTVAVVPEARHGAAAAALMAVGVQGALDAGYRTLTFPLTRADFRWHLRGAPATREYALLFRAL